MKTYWINLSLLFALTVVGCTAIDEVADQDLRTSPSLMTRSSVIFDSDIYYHEGTGLVLQPYDLFENPQVYKPEENVSGITHIGVKFYPKDYRQQRVLDNSEVAYVRYIPFGFSPVVPKDQEWVNDPSSLPKFPEVSPYVIDTKNFKSTEPNAKPTGEIQLPIMYALWPVSEPLPNGIEYEICFKADLNQESGSPSTRSFDYGDYVFNAQFISYDELLDDDIPLRNLKIEMSYDIYSQFHYTNSNGIVSFVPSTIIGLPTSHYTDLSMVVVMNSGDWTISQNSGTTPIHHVIGVASGLWFNPASGTTFISERNSYSTEYEIHRAVDYYFNTNHTLFQGILSSEHGTVFHAIDTANGSVWGETWFSPTADPYINIYNGHPSQNEVIGTTLHEIGHVRMLKNKGYNGYVFCSKTYRESYASFSGWSLGNDYYVSMGFVFPYSGYHINSQNCQTWVPGSGDWYTPFFVDLNDDYNQANLNDPISGVPVNLLDNAAMTYTSITDVGTYLYTLVPTYFTSNQLSNYLTYYSGL